MGFLFLTCYLVISTIYCTCIILFQWEAKVERGQEAFNKISKMIKLEMDRFEKCRIHDFKTMFIKYLENHMEHQSQVGHNNTPSKLCKEHIMLSFCCNSHLWLSSRCMSLAYT